MTVKRFQRWRRFLPVGACLPFDLPISLRSLKKTIKMMANKKAKEPFPLTFSVFNFCPARYLAASKRAATAAQSMTLKNAAT